MSWAEQLGEPGTGTVTDRKFRTRALIASLLVHGVVFLATWNLHLAGENASGSVLAQEDLVELTLIPDESVESEASDQPTEYTAVPERLATEEPPEQADYLALYQSIAADRVLGGEDESPPAAEEESDFNKVAISKEDLDGVAGVTYSEEPLPTEISQPVAKTPEGSAQEAQKSLDAGATGEIPLADESQESLSQTREKEGEAERQDPDQPEWVGGEAPSILKEGSSGARGDRGFDFDQIARGKIEGNVVVSGAYSLNTTDWDFAPWMHRFEQDLYRHWIAPYAYRLGVISGQTKLKLVVEPDGRPSFLEVTDSVGHESLHQASMAALKAFAPYAPLPSDFPEENLVIILTLHYPAWKQEQSPQRREPTDPR